MWSCGANKMPPGRCRAKMAHIRQSRPNSGLGLMQKPLKRLKLFPLRSEAVTPATSQAHGLWSATESLELLLNSHSTPTLLSFKIP